VRIGDLDILPVLDGTAFFAPTEVFAAGKGSDPADWAPHQQFINDGGQVEIALGGFLVRGAGDRTVLVDAGVGRLRSGPFVGGQLLDSLASYGVRPEDITDVVFTHLHFDHVGWATQQGSIVFPNATYRCHTRDWDYFVTGPDGGAARKLGPVEGRLATWEGSGPLLPGIDVQSAEGHTPGSTIIVLSSGTARALLLGDVVHCPVELLDDEWAGMGDVDPELARRTRVALARELEGADVPVAAAHFPGLHFGRLLPAEGRRAWVVTPTG
jgi:glyoxylase-like metal-dependent hydrolase (beta-lactamase superfamily II)